MSYEFAQTLSRILEIGESLEQAVWLGSMFLWLVGFYILYQMYRLRFLKVLMASELCGVVYFLWCHRHSVIGPSDPVTDPDQVLAHMTAITTVEFVLRVLPLLVGTAGAVMGVRYLQRKWKEQEDSQQPARQVSAQTVMADGKTRRKETET